MVVACGVHFSVAFGVAFSTVATGCAALPGVSPFVNGGWFRQTSGQVLPTAYATDLTDDKWERLPNSYRSRPSRDVGILMI